MFCYVKIVLTNKQTSFNFIKNPHFKYLKTTILMTDICLQLLPCSYLQACTLHVLNNMNGSNF